MMILFPASVERNVVMLFFFILKHCRWVEGSLSVDSSTDRRHYTSYFYFSVFFSRHLFRMRQNDLDTSSEDKPFHCYISAGGRTEVENRIVFAFDSGVGLMVNGWFG